MVEQSRDVESRRLRYLPHQLGDYRLEVLKNFVRFYEVDLGFWARCEQEKMDDIDRDNLLRALIVIGLPERVARRFVSRIILCEKPSELTRPTWDDIIGGVGEPRVGGVILKCEGYTRRWCLFPKERITQWDNSEYMGDLLHEVAEMILVEFRGWSTPRAHRKAERLTMRYLRGERVNIVKCFPGILNPRHWFLAWTQMRSTIRAPRGHRT